MSIVVWLALSVALAQDPATPAASETPATPAVSETPAVLPTEAAAPGPEAPQKSEVVAIVRDPQDVKFFKEAQARFDLRMKELEADTRAYIDERAKQETEKISAGYDGAIKALDLDVAERRALAIERFEQFLLKYPDAPYASHVRFRLADLYWGEARESWLAASTAYYAIEEKAIAENTPELIPEMPQMDLARPVALYQRIIADNATLPRDKQYEFLDGTYYSLGFVYAEENSAQYDDALARQQFREMIRVRPDSTLADEAHLNLGTFEFDENNFEGAIAEFKLIYDRGPASKLYPDAVYQLAWAYYKLSVYDKPRPGDPAEFTALSLFTILLDYSEQLVKESGKESDTRPDAIKSLASSFLSLAQDKVSACEDPDKKAMCDPTATPVSEAHAWFAHTGPREYEWDVYRSLATILEDYGRFGDSIAVYRSMQDDARWKDRPENPEFQMQIVKLYASGPEQDLAKSAQARIELTERYNDSTEWWKANKYNPEALSKARNFIEESLADVAIEYLMSARETGSAEEFGASSAKFREYLDKFPMSDDYYQMQWYLAYSLMQSKDYAGAITEYTGLIKSKAHHKFGDGSVVGVLQARLQILQAKYGDLQTLEADATVERTYTSPWKPTDPINVYAYQTEQNDFIAAADLLLKWQFTPQTDPAEQDFSAYVDSQYGKLKYLPAQIAYTHQRFDEARPRLLDIIQDPRTKCTDEASYAANYIVNSYMLEGNLTEVRKYTKQFIVNPPGCNANSNVVGVTLKGMEGTLEGVTFKLAIELTKGDDHVAAATAFLDFMKEFPKSEFRDEALYNAANQYDIAGKVEDANRLYEQFANEYPTDEKSASLYFRIAANNEQVFELGKAVDYYGRLIKNFPTSPVAADAQYNVAFLKIGLGDNLGAAKGFEAYAAKYPDKEDAVDTLWRAGEQYEQVGASQAIAFYEKFRKDHGSEKPDRLLQCDRKIADMYQKLGNTKKYDEYMGTFDRAGNFVPGVILKDWEGIEAAGRTGEVQREGRHAAAESAFREVQAKFDVLTKEKKLSTDQEKDAELLKAKEAGAIAFRAWTISQVTRFGDFEDSTAILYLNAKAILYYVDLGYQLGNCPKSYSEDDCAAYQDILANGYFDPDTGKMLAPPVYATFEEYTKVATQEFVDLIKLAHDKKLWSNWVDLAENDLYELDPFKYAITKKEATGTMDSSMPTEVVPMKIEKVKSGLPMGTTP